MPSEHIQQIIDQILADPRVQNNDAFAGRVFRDEPLLQRGSHMSSYLPEPYKKARALAREPESRVKSSAWVFYHQARILEQCTDDVAYHGTFEHYFPTYQDMNDRQLRGYITWRTAVRAGTIEQTSLSFVFVYLYELLCGIGVEPGVPGFHAIESFWKAYREFEPRLDRYVQPWLRDYAVWHGLDQTYIEPYVDFTHDAALIELKRGLADWEGLTPQRVRTAVELLRGTPAHTPDYTPQGARVHDQGGADRPAAQALYHALTELSSYRLSSSRLAQERPDTLRYVCCATMVQLVHYYARHRRTGLIESFFGSPLAMSYEMFSSSVFWSETPHPDTCYELNEVNRYTCTRGRWYWEGYQGNRGRNTKLGDLMHTVDQRLRDALDFPHPLEARPTPKYLAKIIDTETKVRLAWEREREAHTIHVDLSQLESIRAAAHTTREALLIDEEREDTPSALPNVPTPPATAQPELQTAAPVPAQAPTSVLPPTYDAVAGSTPPTSTLPLSAEERTLLESLLAQKPTAGISSVDMLVDAINEKLFDLLGDTAIEFDGSTPVLIEEYRDDVKGALCS